MKEELGIDAELKVGESGKFEVHVDGKLVAEKRYMSFPSDDEIVDAVGSALGR